MALKHFRQLLEEGLASALATRAALSAEAAVSALQFAGARGAQPDLPCCVVYVESADETSPGVLLYACQCVVSIDSELQDTAASRADHDTRVAWLEAELTYPDALLAAWTQEGAALQQLRLQGYGEIPGERRQDEARLLLHAYPYDLD